MSKRITIILGKMSGGGAERVIANLANYMVNKNGDNIEIIMLLKNKVEYKLPENVKLTYIDTSGKQNFLKPFIWIMKLRENLKKSKPDIILSFFVKINLLVLISSIGLKTPVFISERNDPKSDKRSFIIKGITYLLYPISDGIIFQTNRAKNCFPKLIQKKSVIIPNPVNVNFNFNKEKELNNSIVSVGKLMEQKNHNLLINAFSKISNKFPNYKLYIYGEGHLRKSLEELIIHLKLEEKVFLMGRTSDIFNVVYNSDIFVLSSDYEGMSNALLEAMALETPVISTNCAGSDEIIIDHVNGRLVNVRDCNGLARAIEESITDYSQSEKMAKKAKLKTYELSSDKSFEKWDKFLKSGKLKTIVQ